MEQARLHNRKSTIIFAVDVAHINALVELFRRSGIDAHGINATTDSKEREDILERFRRSEIPVVVNCGILSEGVDIPCVDMLILARPTKSGVLLQQMLGRGMRLYKDKAYCLVLDFVDTIGSRMMQATVPTLLGLDPAYDLCNTSLKEFSPPADCAPLPPESDDSGGRLEGKVAVTLTPFRDPFDLSSVAQDADFIRRLSMLSWVRVDESAFVLCVPMRRVVIRIDRTDGLWTGSLIQNFSGYGGKYFQKKIGFPKDANAPAVVVTHDTLPSALNALDTFIKRSYGYSTYKGLQWNASWREGKTTPGQKPILERIGANVASKGLASDLITRWRFGAGGNFKRAVHLKKRASQQKPRSSWV
ncbi:hypothetical protein HDU91_001787 [Kappamyces sp. JEL0680]|nr:hypothetical protein HDU91_001787 [Kappamyces sp. JEL0680]